MPDKQVAVTGDDLLLAIEPLLIEHAKVASNKKYAAWVLACLRQEIEIKKPGKAPAYGFGSTMDLNDVVVTFAPHPEEDADFDPAIL